MIHRPHVRLLLAVGSTAALVAGCGSSAGSDKDQIAAIIKHAGRDPGALCDHVTAAMLSRLGGKAGCLRQAAVSSADPTTRATSVRVLGRSATAMVVDRVGARTVSFVKEKDGWKVAGIG